MLRFITLASLFLLISACQTARYKEFETIKGGMSKSEVLAAIGGPDRTQRWHGRDRWQYTLYGHPDGDVVREVHFEDGKSTYIGPSIKPAVSADQQDRLHEDKNRASMIRESSSNPNGEAGFEVQRFEPVDDEAKVSQ